MVVKEKILNLCDRWEFSVDKYENMDVSKIIIGSYTCSNYLKYVADYVEQNGLQLPAYDLALPVFSEQELFYLEVQSIQNLIKSANRVIVNDFGLLHRLSNFRIRLGRLIFKDYRDKRYNEYDSMEYYLEPMNIIVQLRDLGYDIDEIECDIITQKFFVKSDESIKIYVHYPYRQVSSSHICEFASIGKHISEKFRPNDKCTHDCKNVMIKTQNPDYIKIGKGVYEEISKDYIKDLVSDITIIITPRWL